MSLYDWSNNWTETSGMDVLQRACARLVQPLIIVMQSDAGDRSGQSLLHVLRARVSG